MFHGDSIVNNDELNEFLSSLYLSSNAFADLLDELKNSDRDIVVAMCGDHKPPIDIDSNYSGFDKNLRTCSTPFIIWSNKSDIVNDYLYGNNRISMIYFVPTLFEAINMPVSNYYRFLIELRNKIPVLSRYDYYYSISGDFYNYNDKNDYTDSINEYFNYECFNINYPTERTTFFNGGLSD